MSDQRNFEVLPVTHAEVDDTMDIDGDLSELDEEKSLEVEKLSTAFMLQEPSADDDEDDDDEEYQPGSDLEDVDTSDDDDDEEKPTVDDIIEGAHHMAFPSYAALATASSSTASPSFSGPSFRSRNKMYNDSDDSSESEDAEFSDSSSDRSVARSEDEDDDDDEKEKKQRLPVARLRFKARDIPTSFLLQAPADGSTDDDDEEYVPGTAVEDTSAA